MIPCMILGRFRRLLPAGTMKHTPPTVVQSKGSQLACVLAAGLSSTFPGYRINPTN